MSIVTLPNILQSVNVNQTAARDPHPSIGQISNADKDPSQNTISDSYPSGAGEPTEPMGESNS